MIADAIESASQADVRRRQLLAGLGPPAESQSAAQMLRALIDAGLDTLPLPAAGSTLQRWRALSEVACHDLSLAKLFESHTDALAILQELDDPEGAPPGSAWGVWAAEPPDARVITTASGHDRVTLTGRKSWCSGASHLSHALITVWDADGSGPFLAKVNLNQEAVRVSSQGWNAVGMAATGSVDVHFSAAAATRVGTAGAYLDRPGFWHGGVGIAACWYGGAVRLARSLRDEARARAGAGGNDFRAAALGKVDLALHQTASLLRAAAAEIDDHPRDDASVLALRVRMGAEECAVNVLHQTGRALGAASFCKDAGFARMAADLPVFIRQSGGERDAVAVGESAAAGGARWWAL